jgi:hypothetical protein
MRREPPVRIREGLGVQLPRATRLVICCRGTADEAMTVMRGMISKLKLTVNETKTRMCRLPDETFDFLGYTLGRNYDCRTGKSYPMFGVHKPFARWPHAGIRLFFQRFSSVPRPVFRDGVVTLY